MPVPTSSDFAEDHLPAASEWESLLSTDYESAGWIDPTDFFGLGMVSPDALPRGLAVRTLSDGRVELEGIAMYLSDAFTPGVPSFPSTIATLPPELWPSERQPVVIGHAVDIGDQTPALASLAVGVDGGVALMSSTQGFVFMHATWDLA